jgi:hypothetical protein
MATDRFDLEQQILDCWKVTDDIKLLSSNEAKPEDFSALAAVYEFKFNQLWNTFETMCAERQFVTPTKD